MGFLAEQLVRHTPAGWEAFFATEAALPYFSKLDDFVTARAAAGPVYPPVSAVFAAFAVPPTDIRAVILGQDPYHEEGQAMGLAFSVRTGVKCPPSLRNIRQELECDLGLAATGTDLTPWANQGVFLLNAVLTVDAGQAFSHAGQGWETFVDHALRYLCTVADTPLAVVLWGAAARKNKALFTACCRHRPLLVVESAHPSPLSAYRGFFGSRPFGQINNFLAAHGSAAIDWRF